MKRRNFSRSTVLMISLFICVQYSIGSAFQTNVPTFVQTDVFAMNSKLLASTSAKTAGLGNDVAISGDTAVVGASSDNIGSNIGQGAVYVYVRRNGIWVEQAKLIAANGRVRDHFGYRVAIDGDTIVVGTPLASKSNSREDRYKGAAYVFTRKGDNWEQQIELKPSDAAGASTFGSDVAVSGDTIVIGAAGNDNLPFDKVTQAHGAGFVYKRSGGNWTEEKKLVNEKSTSAALGITVAIHEKTIVLGAASDVGAVGAALVFVNNGTGWKLDGTLRSGVKRGNEHFALEGLAIDRGTIVVGASSAGSRLPGAAYVFNKGTAGWALTQKLTAADSDKENQFGRTLGISGDKIIIGMFQLSGPLAPRGYVFDRKLTQGKFVWVQSQLLISPETFLGDSFAQCVGISGNHIVIGASNHDSDPKRKTRGAAYIYGYPLARSAE